MNAPTSAGALPPQLSEDLAAASRILVAQGVVDGFGHVSMRHPSAPDRYLMSRSIAPALVTPADIMIPRSTAIPATPTADRVFSNVSYTAKSIRRARM